MTTWNATDAPAAPAWAGVDRLPFPSDFLYPSETLFPQDAPAYAAADAAAAPAWAGVDNPA